ncbi:MAG: mevalonate kinase [Conexivisphaerales archaeon]
MARAPGKAILLGEHFVVHGGSALAVALDRGVTAKAEMSADNRISSVRNGDQKLTSSIEGAEGFLAPAAASLRKFMEDYRVNGISVSISSEIPEGAGLGSSAASSVAAIAAASALFGINLSRRKLYEYSMFAERIVHGRPSGIDSFVSVNGGLVFMKKRTRKKVECRPFRLMVAYSGMTRSTGEMIARVDEYRKREPKSFRNLMRALNALVPDVVSALQSGELAILAAAMNFNHEALKIIGVSNQKLDLMVRRAREDGFAGAKLTGAGGGGCIIALPKLDGEKELASFRQKYADSFLCNVPGEGVRSWLE